MKRIFDFSFALLFILLILPVYLVVILAILILDGRPIFFSQVRVGQNLEHFKIHKFRTMVVGASKIKDGYAVKANDMRITQIGGFLRKYSLDELPQLFNVLKGDLSFIGPRPMLPQQMEFLSEEQKLRFTVPQGVTGLAVVTGRANILWSKRIEIDIKYVKTRSLWLDLKVLYKTFLLLVRPQNIYNEGPDASAFDLNKDARLPQDDD